MRILYANLALIYIKQLLIIQSHNHFRISCKYTLKICKLLSYFFDQKFIVDNIGKKHGMSCLECGLIQETLIIQLNFTRVTKFRLRQHTVVVRWIPILITVCAPS